LRLGRIEPARSTTNSVCAQHLRDDRHVGPEDQTLSRAPGVGKPCADSAAPRISLSAPADPALFGRGPFPSAPLIDVQTVRATRLARGTTRI
jgi:hypothetical protein